jgi:class 3 adenylate cyclase
MTNRVKSKIKTVMFIDIAEYTKTTTLLNREQFDELHELFDNIALPTFNSHDGKVIKKIGDAFLVTFDSATQAVLCGIELQKLFFKQTRNLHSPFKIRVAIHSGEIIERKGDIYGATVNTAARIEGIAKAGHIVFSETVYNAMNKNEIRFTFLGKKKLKGIRRPVALFKVKTGKDKYLKRRIQDKRSKKTFRRNMKNLISFLIFLAFIFGLLWILFKLLI